MNPTGSPKSFVSFSFSFSKREEHPVLYLNRKECFHPNQVFSNVWKML